MDLPVSLSIAETLQAELFHPYIYLFILAELEQRLNRAEMERLRHFKVEQTIVRIQCTCNIF